MVDGCLSVGFFSSYFHIGVIYMSLSRYHRIYTAQVDMWSRKTIVHQPLNRITKT